MEFGGNTKQFIAENPYRARGLTNRPQDCRGTSSTKSQCYTPQQEERKTNFSTGGSQIKGSQRAILPAPCIHFLATAGKLATERVRGNRELSSGPYFEAKKSINLATGHSFFLYAGTTKGQDAAYSSK